MCSLICVIHCDMSSKHFFKGTKWRGNAVTIPLVKEHGLTNHGMFDVRHSTIYLEVVTNISSAHIRSL